MNWPLVAIKDVAKVITGKTPSKREENNFVGSIPFVTPAELNGEVYVNNSLQTLSDKGASTVKLVPQNSVMVCCIGSLGKLAIAGRKLATNQQINSVFFNEKKVDSKYGYYALSRLKPQMESLASSTTIAIINKSNFESLEIPLPPLSEQKRIAAILDKADAIRRKRQQAIQLADEFLSAVFLDMFGDPVTNPKGFPLGAIRDLVSSANYGSSAKASETDGEYPYLRMGNITYEGSWDFSSLKYIDLDDKDKNKYLVRRGDLLFNRTNSKELVGKAAVYEEDKPMAFAGYLIRVRPNKKANNYYISGYLNSKHGKSTLLNMCKSIVGMANINAQEMQDISILIPPMSLQDKYEQVVQAIKDRLKMFHQSEAELERLFLSLSQKAFSAKL